MVQYDGSFGDYDRDGDLDLVHVGDDQSFIYATMMVAIRISRLESPD